MQTTSSLLSCQFQFGDVKQVNLKKTSRWTLCVYVIRGSALRFVSIDVSSGSRQRGDNTCTRCLLYTATIEREQERRRETRSSDWLRSTYVASDVPLLCERNSVRHLKWAARKRWAAGPSTQSSTIESSVVHVVDYRPRQPLTVVRGSPAGLRRWCCHAKSEWKTRVTSRPFHVGLPCYDGTVTAR